VCDALSIGNWLPTFRKSVFLKVKDSRKVCGFSWTVDPEREGTALMFPSLHGVTSHSTVSLNADSRRFDTWGQIHHSLSTVRNFMLIS
jgi:hypothetical protein